MNHSKLTQVFLIKGFTLIELLISISILFIISAMSLPSFSSILSKTRQDGEISMLMSHLQLTRKEAIYKNRTMLMCKSKDQLKCSSDAQWEDGWLIFYDENKNKQRDDNENITSIKRKTNQQIKIIYRSFSGSNKYVKFYNKGYSHTNGTFIICNPLGAEHTKTVVLSQTGRIRLNEMPTLSDQKKCLVKI